MRKVSELHQARAKACDELMGLSADKAAFDAKVAEVDALEGEIQRAEAAQARQAALARPVGGSAEGGAATGEQTAFRSLGEQMLAVFHHANSRGSVSDQRLIRAPLGLGEADPSAGGFLVQTDFSNAILQRIYETGKIAGGCTRFNISSAANGIKIPAVDETSRQDGQRFGGTQVYWVAEGAPIGPSRPRIRTVDLDLKKLAGIVYMSDELLSEASAVATMVNTMVTQEIAFVFENSILRGTGAGQPLGILNSPCKISVAAEKGQAKATMVKENIDNMWSRMWGPSRDNAVWFVNQDVEPQLNQMYQSAGAGGWPVYLPAGSAGSNLAGKPQALLYGRPLVSIEQASTVGTEGDIILADMAQYILAQKGEVQSAQSMHVQFLTDQMAFRFIYRVDGQPWWNAPLTPAQGTNTKSPFVTLAAR